MDSITNRKRLLYDINEDIYFYTYNIIFILNTLQCYSSEESFKDYRKLVFLIDFISNRTDCDIFIKFYKGKLVPNETIKRYLRDKYYLGMEKIRFLRYILLMMEKHGYIKLENEDKRANVILIKENHSEEFLNDKRFREVIDTINRIPARKILKKVSYKTFIDNIFRVNGVVVWED